MQSKNSNLNKNTWFEKLTQTRHTIHFVSDFAKLAKIKAMEDNFTFEKVKTDSNIVFFPHSDLYSTAWEAKSNHPNLSNQ